METVETVETGKTGIIGKIGETVESRLRMMCDRLSPQTRLVAVIISLMVFAVMAIYMAVSSVYGHHRTEPDIQHIKGLDLKMKNDSINTLKIKDYGNDDEQ